MDSNKVIKFHMLCFTNQGITDQKTESAITSRSLNVFKTFDLFSV